MPIFTKQIHDPINTVDYTVNILSEEEELMFGFSDTPAAATTSMEDDGTIVFNFKRFSSDTIAHEAWHGIEKALFQNRGYTMNLDQYNEHIAYALGWLVGEITDIVQEWCEAEEKEEPYEIEVTTLKKLIKPFPITNKIKGL